MTRRLLMPFLLPATSVAIVLLLGLKASHIVRAATPPVTTSAGETHAPPTHSAAVHARPANDASIAAPKPAPTVGPDEAPVSAQERELLLDLRHRKVALDAREAALGTRDEVIAAAEKRLALRFDELATLQKRLEALEANRKARDDANWQGLVKLYEQMKPREAAAILNDLDKPVLLQVVGRMKEARAAPILAAMQPERARELTADMAQARARENQAPGANPPPAKATTQPQGTK